MSEVVNLASSTPSSELSYAEEGINSLSTSDSCLRLVEDKADTKKRRKSKRRSSSSNHTLDVQECVEWRRQQKAMRCVDGDGDTTSTPGLAMQRDSVIVNIRQSWLGMDDNSIESVDSSDFEHRVVSLTSSEGSPGEPLKPGWMAGNSICSSTEAPSSGSDHSSSSSDEDPSPLQAHDNQATKQEMRVSHQSGSAHHPPESPPDDVSSGASSETPATDCFIQELMSMDDDICSLSCCMFGCRCDIEGYKCLSCNDEEDSLYETDHEPQKLSGRSRSRSEPAKEQGKTPVDNQKKDEDEPRDKEQQTKENAEAPQQTSESSPESIVTTEERNGDETDNKDHVTTSKEAPSAEKEPCGEISQAEDDARHTTPGVLAGASSSPPLEGQDIFVQTEISFPSASQQSTNDSPWESGEDNLDEESFGEFQCWTETTANSSSPANDDEVAAGKVEDGRSTELAVPKVIATTTTNMAVKEETTKTTVPHVIATTNNTALVEDNSASVYTKSLDSLVIAFKERASVWDDSDMDDSSMNGSVQSSATTPASWIPVWEDVSDDVPRSSSSSNQDLDDDGSVRTSTSAPSCLMGNSHYATRARLRTEEEIFVGALQAAVVAKEIEKSNQQAARKRWRKLLFSRKKKTTKHRRRTTNRTGKDATSHDNTTKLREQSESTTRMESTTFGRNIKFLTSMVRKSARR